MGAISSSSALVSSLSGIPFFSHPRSRVGPLLYVIIVNVVINVDIIIIIIITIIIVLFFFGITV